MAPPDLCRRLMWQQGCPRLQCSYKELERGLALVRKSGIPCPHQRSNPGQELGVPYLLQLSGAGGVYTDPGLRSERHAVIPVCVQHAKVCSPGRVTPAGRHVSQGQCRGVGGGGGCTCTPFPDPAQSLGKHSCATACFNLRTWVPGGPMFMQNSFAVPWISVPGPKHTFLDVALWLESCTNAKCLSIFEKIISSLSVYMALEQ